MRISKACFFLLVLSAPAEAYLDPATGGYLLQAIVAGLLTAFYAIKHFGKSIWYSITGRKAEEEDEATEGDGDGESAPGSEGS